MKQKTGRKLLAFLLTLALVVGLMPGMGLTAYAASTTVTWNASDITKTGGNTTSFTKDGITITGTTIDYKGDKNFIGPGTFTTGLGKFTQIEVTAKAYAISGTSWSGGTWTGDASDSVSYAGTISGPVKIVFTIETADEKNKETTPTTTFTATGADTGTLSGVTDGMTYSLDGTSWTDITSSTNINLTGLSAGTIKVVKKGNGTTTSDSDPQSITVTKAKTPNLTITQPTVVGGKGTVATTTSHEYSSDNGSSWTACTANQEFEAGAYLIRVKASGTVLASGNQSVTITAFNPSKETTPSATFTATGADTGTLSGVADGMKYSLDSGTTWTDITSSTNINLTGLSAGTIKVVKKGNGTTTIDSDPQSITVTKAETPNLTVTQPTVVGGKGTVATTTSHEYSSDNGSSWTACTANQEFEAGAYLIRVKASGTVLASGNQSVTITAFNPSKETTPSATFTATGADTGTLSGVADGMKYSLDSGTTWTDITSSTNINLTGLSAGTIKVVKKGNGTTTIDSDPQSITVTKAETPNLTVTQPTVVGGKGTVATTTAHEYSSDNGSSWTACTANQEFAAGTYLIRVKASGTVLASGNQSVTITAYNPSKESVKPEVPTDKLVYNGKDQPLVEAGKAEGGTLLYAIGADGKTAPTEGWSETVPTGKNAGTYFVWYMVKGDENHNDTKPACVEATIAKKGLTVTAEAKSKTQGEADPALTYTAEGLVGSDTLTGALSREAGEDPGTHAITQGTLTAGDNYEITFTSAVLTINKKDEPAPAPSGGGGGYYGGGTVQNQRRDAYSDVIGAAATSFRDSSPERIRNIELACEKLDGIVLQPGEVFSFNEALGGLTAEAGFEVAPVNPDDDATAEMGGGVSQAASTLYTGSLFALLETVERTNHPFAVPFIQPGTDAYVTDPGNADALDLKFRNTRGEPIRISAKIRVDEARQVREIVIELRSALGSSDYMPIRFDNTWGGDQNAFLTATPYDLTRPGYRILLTHEEQAFTDDRGAGIRTLTHRKILDAAGMLVRDEILNSKLPDGSYAMDTYYQG